MIAILKEFDWSYELAMYAGTGTFALIALAAIGGVVLGVRYLLRSGRDRRSDTP